MGHPVKKVFLVEDEPEIAAWIKNKMERFINLDLINWCDRLDGTYDLLLQASPDILILDLKLPDGNGLDLLKEINKNDLNIKVFVLSVNSVARNACLRAGADYFFDKASETDYFLEKLSIL
ncbi:MAG TPA: response regulator [Bacteroidales bacterium]|nr:response regulator [Bacteroidales bacterium]